MTLRILHTNDMHGTLTAEKLERLQALRADADVYFDTGDVIKTGNLGIPLRPEPAWPALDQLRCTASVLGNRETHILSAAFQAKIAGARHPVMCANLHRRDGTYPLPRTLAWSQNDLRIGVVAVMVPMVTPRMKTQAASAYLWDASIPTALELGQALRSEVDLLICLSHMGMREDRRLAESSPFDVILGGHSHTVLETPERIGETFICQGGSHNRFAGVYQWDTSAPIRLTGGLVSLA